MDLEAVAQRLSRFVAERDWDRFHTPKNLAMALVGEAGELASEFQWLERGDVREMEEQQLRDVRREMADVAIYLIRLADVLGVDLAEAVEDKIRENEEKYPVEKVRGVATKYTRLEG